MNYANIKQNVKVDAAVFQVINVSVSMHAWYISTLQDHVC